MNKLLLKICLVIFSIMIISVFLGGVIYSANQLKYNPNPGVSEIFFWSALMLLFLGQIEKAMEGMDFRKSKQERKTQ